MPFRAVFFDFGGTLFSYRPFQDRFEKLLQETALFHGVAERPLPELRRVYVKAIAPVLRSYASRSFYLHRDLFGDFGEAYVRALGAEPTADSRSLFYAGQTEVAAPLIEPREGARETLLALRERGLHLSVVSNIDDDQFAILWTRWGLGNLMDAVTTSEGARSCKPDSRIFQAALEKADGPAPAEVAFVGDSLDQDIAGAKRLGMTTVLLSEREPPTEGVVEPTYRITHLPQLLDILGNVLGA